MPALSDFKNEIARIDKVADWLTTPPALASDMFPATWAVRCGAVVLLSGYLESYIKASMNEFITQVNSFGHPLTKLPKKMTYTHFRAGAKALERQVRDDIRVGSTARCESIATRLASISSVTGYTLVWEAFAETRSNPNSEVVKEVLSAVGVKEPWAKLRAASPPGLIDLSAFLTSFILMRNECAHSGNTISPPSASDLIAYGQNLVGLGTAMNTVLGDRLTEIAGL
jgi:hypothetical protein